MKKCTSCKISFNTSEELCPLCQNKLKGNKYDNIFPVNIRLKTNELIYKILVFISLATVILSTFIELYLSKNIRYTFIIFEAIVTNLVIVYFILKNHQNVLKMFEKYGLFLVILTLLWYFITKSVIITNYIIPSLCIFELVFNLITFIVLKHNYIVNFLGLLLINVILLIVPILLVLFGCTTFKLLSYICFVAALIIIVGLLIFYFDEIKEEFIKIFNV